ncbi:tRNA (adenosine(37)-N6)-dimethylallyltransferase MiaA [Sinomonas humi]|uniref:tRNA dimethylallyltransferase n=1 Tax=Sinomonas humi TaxID=1338436 RepID=A0A0B2AG69_9MICC|nr:tRNA (adenosine(37)-N6)-dimethylallyltransferase MiaA [Sinomonas humi]KHL00789.1 tRNA delta(2)-isopentenylpyrophosphate transferase [Sinomonas humi]
MDRGESPGPVIAVVGPTGTGKSDLAVELALALDGEIVNTDSMQFYRGMDIGTAKLSVEERRGVPHHLLDILDVHEDASVSAFQTAARAAIEDIHSRGRRAILAGGSGLYVRAATDVLEFPGTDPAVRARLEKEAESEGIGALARRLQEIDPESASRLRDARRIIRALEVREVTGRPFSSFMPRREYVQPTLQIGLDMDRPSLHSRLAERVRGMVRAGLVDEVRRLEGEGLREGRTASRALGYAQFLRVLDGEATAEEAAEETIIATRQFARRQVTWFRADPRVQWLDALRPDVVAAALALVSSTGSAGGVGILDA